MTQKVLKKKITIKLNAFRQGGTSPLKEMLILMLTFSKITMGADKEDMDMLQDFL
jgi:hypothetical protein